MLRPSISRGRPALGCAESLTVATCAMRSIVSSIAAGPTLQFRPTTWAPRRFELRHERSGGAPSRLLPSSSVVTCATIGRSQTLADRADRGANLVDVAERLEHEQVDAPFEQRRAPARGRAPPPRRRRSSPTARCGCRADRSRRRRRPARAPRAARCCAPCRLIACTWSPEPERAELDPVGAERVGLDDVGAGPHVAPGGLRRRDPAASGSARRTSDSGRSPSRTASSPSRRRRRARAGRLLRERGLSSHDSTDRHAVLQRLRASISRYDCDTRSRQTDHALTSALDER